MYIEVRNIACYHSQVASRANCSKLIDQQQQQQQAFSSSSVVQECKSYIHIHRLRNLQIEARLCGALC